MYSLNFRFGKHFMSKDICQRTIEQKLEEFRRISIINYEPLLLRFKKPEYVSIISTILILFYKAFHVKFPN